MKENLKAIVFFAVVGLLLWAATKGNPLAPVSKAPFKTDKLSVLIVEKTEERGKLTAGQRAAIQGSVVTEFVNAKKGSFLKLDADQTQFDKVDPWVAEAFKLHGPPPWIVAAGSKTGFSKALPADIAETLKDLEGVK